jgi:predicted dehydrogenase
MKTIPTPNQPAPINRTLKSGFGLVSEVNASGSGKACLNRRGFLKLGLASVLLSDSELIGNLPRALGQEPSSNKPVRLGVIGTGNRGRGLMRVLSAMPGVEFSALCDINPENLELGMKIVQEARQYRPEGYAKGPFDYRRMIERRDLDAVMIATPAALHASMSIDCLLAGKNVGAEVPGAYTLEECWALIRAKEKSGRHYMLLENYNYTQDRMMIYSMIRQGLFGRLYYGECAYLHETDAMNFNRDGSLTWRGELRRDASGNWYPTHSIGPVSKWMEINDGDRLDTIVCMQSAPVMAHLHAAEQFGSDSEQAKIKWKTGEYICCLIQTAQGRMIKMDFGPVSPRPHQIYYGIQGTKGGWDSRLGVYLKGVSGLGEQQRQPAFEPLAKFTKSYDSPYWREMRREAAGTGHGGGDYFVLHDFIQMARQDREPWIDVYDSATWSILYECSRQSLEKGGSPVSIPDFTEGRWKQSDWRQKNLRPS